MKKKINLNIPIKNSIVDGCFLCVEKFSVSFSVTKNKNKN